MRERLCELKSRKPIHSVPLRHDFAATSFSRLGESLNSSIFDFTHHHLVTHALKNGDSREEKNADSHGDALDDTKVMGHDLSTF